MTKTKLDRPRSSLQPHSSQPIFGALRHTQSQNYTRKHSSGVRKKVPTTTIPTIHEVDDSEFGRGDLEIVNEKKREKKRDSVSSKGRSYVYDNAGFEGNVASTVGSRQEQFHRSSTQHSFMSTTSSMKDTSIKSLP